MLHMILGGAGTGKTSLLLKTVQAACESGAHVFTLVPETFAFTYDKLLYRVLGAQGFNRMRSGSFTRLTADILAEHAEEPRDAADTVMQTAALHLVITELTKARVLRFYGVQTQRPDFLPAASAQIAELLQSGTSPEALAEAAAATTGALSEKLFDLAEIYSAYLKTLEQRGFRDRLGDLTEAAALADGSSCLRGMQFFLDEFESFTGDQYKMLEVMLRDAEEVYIALRTDDIDAPDYTRFDAVSETARRLRRLAKECGTGFETVLLEAPRRYAHKSLEHLSRCILVPGAPAYAGESAVTIAEARDITLEAEYAAAQIHRLLTDGVCRACDIMVVMHDLSAYGALIEAAFQRYEIPYFMDQRRSVLHTAVMQLPLALIALMQRTTTAQMLLLLKTQLCPLHPAQAAELENYAFEWDIEGVQWDRPFAPETDSGGICEGIRLQIMPAILRMRRAADKADMTGDRLCEILYKCMEDLQVPHRVIALTLHMSEQGNLQGARALRHLWEHFTELLDALHDALTDVPMNPKALGGLLTAVLRGEQLPTVPQTLDAVTVINAAAARYDSPKAVFVLGVNAGQFPADISESGFFSEQERAELAEHHVELSRSVRDLCADERLIVCKTLSAASHFLWLCYPLAAESGRRLQPSELIAEVQHLLPESPLIRADELGAAFYVTTKAAAYYSFVQDYRTTPAERAAVRGILAAMPEEAARIGSLQAASDPGRLRITDPARMRKLTGDVMQISATQIETLMACPFEAFCKNGLRLKVRRKHDLNPLSGGDLVHFCMERLLNEHPEREDFLSMDEAALRAHTERCAADFLRDQLGGALGRPARFLRQYARLTRRMLALLKHTQEEMRQSQFAPDACELVIGRVGGETGTAPLHITLSNGVTLCLNGKIDRVDVTEQDGQQYLRIVDYKTGKKQFRLSDLYYGLNLQMLLYLFAISDDPEAYPGAAAAGVLYMPAGSPGLQDREQMVPVSELLTKHFRMSGTVLCDRGILTKMEAELAGVYIPAQVSEHDTGEGQLRLTKDSQVFSPKQMARLRKYVMQIVQERMEAYTAGETAPSPLSLPGRGDDPDFDACKTCDCAGLCGITEADSARFRAGDAKEAEEAMKKIIGKRENPKQ